METFPKVVIVISGKRKSGKDHIAECLKKIIDKEKSVILRLSAPLKKQYALEHGLDYDRLLDASDYKEKFRADMIRWGEEKRNKDPGFFCRLTSAGDDAKVDVWLISDARRKTDVEYFTTLYKQTTLTVRVCATQETRVSRGYTFTKGVDDAESECGLDEGVDWDFIVQNDGDEINLQKSLDDIFNRVNIEMSYTNPYIENINQGDNSIEMSYTNSYIENINQGDNRLD